MQADYIKINIPWFLAKTRDILIHPIIFFRSLPARPGYREPLLFLGVVWVINLAGSSLLDAFGLLTKLPYATGLTQTEELALDLLSLPLTMLLLFGLSRLFGGQGTWQQAVAMVAYAGAYLILPELSFLGYVFGFYGLFLLYLGNKTVFGLSVRRACFVFLLFALILTALTGALGYFLHALSHPLP